MKKAGPRRPTFSKNNVADESERFRPEKPHQIENRGKINPLRLSLKYVRAAAASKARARRFQIGIIWAAGSRCRRSFGPLVTMGSRRSHSPRRTFVKADSEVPWRPSASGALTKYRRRSDWPADHTAGSMEPTMRALRVLLILALVIVPCFATAGFAEWEIKTPGGNLISHVDPLIAANGTCLRSAQAKSVYVAHLEWWRYYRNAVAGKAQKGFFILDETSHAVTFFGSEAELNGAIVERRSEERR